MMMAITASIARATKAAASRPRTVGSASCPPEGCSTIAVGCSAMDRRLHCLGGPILGDRNAREFGDELLRQLRCHRLDFLHRSVTCFADAVLCRLGPGADFDVGRLYARLGFAQRFLLGGMGQPHCLRPAFVNAGAVSGFGLAGLGTGALGARKILRDPRVTGI